MATSTPWGSRQVVEESAEEWFVLQKKTFTRWCNSYLRERSIEIDDLFTDVSDGTVLLNLLEIIGQETILSVCGRKFYPPQKCKMDIHKLENCNLIFDYLKQNELKIVNIGSSDIKDGSPRLVLGLIWTIILRFAISEDGKEGLLLWCRKNCAGYEGVDVQNFHRSWTDGLAFCALINHFRPDLIDFNECLARRGEPMTNLNLAFDVAKNELDIDRLLDAEDICGSEKPDEKSIIAYLSLFFKKFAALAQKDNLAEAIRKAVDVTQHHEGLVASYDADSESLLSWIRVQADKFGNNGLDISSTEEVKEVIENLHSFKNGEKPAKQQLLASSEALLANLRLSQRNNERPLYAPKIEVEDIETEWAAMEKSEKTLEDGAIELLDAFERTDYALQRFGNKIAKVEEFVAANNPVFTATDYGDSVQSCSELLKKCEVFEMQAPKYSTMLKSCDDFVQMCAPKHSGSAAAKEKYDAVSTSISELEAAEAAFKTNVAAALDEQKRLLALKEKFVAALVNYEFDLFEAQEALLEPISLCNSVAAIEKVIKSTEEVKASLEKSEATLVELEGMSSELAAANYPVEKDASSVRELYNTLQESLSKRFADLGHADASQSSKEAIKKAFAESSAKLMEYCNETSRVVSSLTRRMSVTAEKQAEKLDDIMTTFSAEAPPLMEAVESANESQVAAEIFVNPLTSNTIFSCRLVYGECEKNLKSAVDINTAHIQALNGKSEMSAEQAKEIREAFEAFDKDKSGKLSVKEFQDGLMAMGIVLNDDESEAEFKKRDLDGSGTLSFDEFAEYILEQYQSGSSESDILSAFKGLCDGKATISEAEVKQWFPVQQEYMSTRLGEGGEYEGFVTTMFKV
jgi:Ca2+-binding EF-hand superfamily protein